MQQVHLLITGKVQGVWYRVFVKDTAEKLGLTGWVRNTESGDVEAVIQGETGKINELLVACHEGPPLAKVTSINEEWQKAKDTFSEFQII